MHVNYSLSTETKAPIAQYIYKSIYFHRNIYIIRGCHGSVLNREQEKTHYEESSIIKNSVVKFEKKKKTNSSLKSNTIYKVIFIKN